MADAREPGAPIPKDEIDPDLVSLRPATQVGLITAASVVMFCVFLALRLWGDFQFAGEPDQPRAVTAAQVAAGEVAAESHVTVAGTLERAAAVRVRPGREQPGLRVVPVAGTGDRVWVAIDGDGWVAPRADLTGYTGRLRRLSELPFEGSFRGYVRANPTPRMVAAEELHRAHAAGETTLTAVTGDTFTVAPGDPVEAVVTDPDAALVIGSFGQRFPDAAAWSAALAAAGLVEPGARPIRVDDGAQAWFEVRRPGALAAAPRALEAAGLWGARVEAITRQLRAPWSELGVSTAGVTLDGATLPWSSLDVVAVRAARPLPGDPWILVAGEAPEAYWYVRPLYVLLALFAALFSWALVRTVRRELLSPKANAPA